MSTFMTTLSNPWLVLTLAGLLPLLYYLIRVCLVNGVACKSKKRLDGKTVIITGGNTGIGYETALELAHRGARIIIACRDKTRGENAVLNVRNESENDNVLFRKLDLASCTSIHTFASKILTEESQIDILICNAGVMFTPYCLTEDGFEMQFGTNHLGHFLLTNLLLDRLKESSPSRVVVVASLAHMAGYLDFNDMMWTKKYNPQLSYCRSKLANVMFARELSKRVAGSGVTVCSLHPGTVYTEITRHLLSGWLIVLKPIAHLAMYLFTKTLKQGAQTPLHCVIAPEVEGRDGAYWDSCVIKKPVSRAMDNEACRRLWEYSAKLVGLEE